MLKKINALVHTVEQVLYGKNLKCVSPFAFQRNLVAYSTTHSKLLTKLAGNWEPSGSYTTVNTILNQPSEPVPPPTHDIHVTFDNNQKVGFSSGRIREGSTVPFSICTSMTYIEPQPPTAVQQNSDFTNDKWLNDITHITARLKTLEEEAMQEFRRYRSSFIDEHIKHLVKEHGKGPKDYVDLSIVQKNLGQDNIVCVKCCQVYQKRDNKVCPKCNHDPCHAPPNHDPYFLTETHVTGEKPKVIIGETCLVNPNCRNSIKTVLNHIKTVCKIPEQRKWVVVWSDGVPYIQMEHIIETVYTCSICNAEVDTKDVTFEKHSTDCHPGEEPTFTRAFEFIIPRPGPGHIEMNIAKILMDVGWLPIISHFCHLLGFRSPKAQLVVKTGTNHHRSRSILSCVLHSMASELLLPYVKLCQTQGRVGNSQEFFTWISSDVNDPVYMFLFDFTFTYLLAFHLYNEATRKSHHERMLAARVAFAPLFYVRRRPIYQELHLRDLVQIVSWPAELWQYLEHFPSFSVTGLPNRAQGADFIQEEQNKVIKSFLPPGMPSGDTWTKVCRKVDRLRAMRNVCL